MIEIIDQMDTLIRLETPPRRIVSLVPSQTELLADLGLEDQVVGITKFCIHPDRWFRSKTRVGGTKQINIEKVRALRPDLIIGNKEENTESDILALREIAQVYMSDIEDLPQALSMICDLGVLSGKLQRSEELTARIRAEFDNLEYELNGKTLGKVAYFIWYNPDYLAGNGTFINAMLTAGGWENVTKQDRYPEANAIISPDLVFLSTEPFPFKEEHIAEFQNKYPGALVKIVDGEMFSWYGSRLLKSPGYFRKLLHEFSEKKQSK